MTAESKQESELGVKPPILLNPLLVALVALVLYGLTLNHWVTFNSLPFVSQIAGWDWHPGPLSWRPDPQYHPLFLILTYPLRLLPLNWRAVGLNVFAAICAALTLAILARSVRLLSHDRSQEHRSQVFTMIFSYLNSIMSLDSNIMTHDRGEERRLRERGEVAMLSVRAAFLPVAFAVLMLATQLTFWENAVAGTGEMIDLLVFAFLILCLLEFRNSRQQKWLNLFTFVYGLGLANSWALIGFFPCFLFALLWLKRIDFFNPPSTVDNQRIESIISNTTPTLGSYFVMGSIWLKRIWLFNWKFLFQMTGLGILGLMLYGLIPLLGVIHHDGNFWEMLRHKWTEQHIYLILIPRYYVIIAGLPTLIPLMMALFDWPSIKGEFNPRTDPIARFAYRTLAVVFLAVGVLFFFDIHISPSPRSRFGLGVTGGPSFLTFYYLAALSVGYFSAYLMLVFGKEVAYRWGQRVGILQATNLGGAGLIWASAIVFPVLLFFANFTHIRDDNNPVVSNYAREMARCLPPVPSVVVSDDPARLYLTMGASQRLGLPDQYIFVEAQSLPHGDYLRYLVNRYPAFRKELAHPENIPEKITDLQVGLLLGHLAAQQPVYYLNPAFGPYFEPICMTPYRLGGLVHPDPTNNLATLVLNPREAATNQAYWHALEKESLASLPDLARKSTDALRIASYYSQTLDYWGTELQKTATELKISTEIKDSMLKSASDQFAEAVLLNTNNIIARLNQQYNALLRGVKPAGATLSWTNVAAQFYYHWDFVLSLFGPSDTPDLDTQIGRFFAAHGLKLQAAHEYQRCLKLAPNYPVGELDLAQTYIDLGLMDAALGYLKDIRSHFTGNPQDLLNMEILAYATKKDFAEADKLLTEERAKHPKDPKFDSMMAEFYVGMGYAVLREGKRTSTNMEMAEKNAAVWFHKALASLDEELQLLTDPAAYAQQISEANLRKAELQMAMKDFQAAIATFTEILRHDPDKPVALLNRAISEMELNRLDDAKTDYQDLERTQIKPWPAVYRGLAQVAQKQNDKAAQIRYNKLFLQIVPTNTQDFTDATRQLQQLEGH